MAMDLSQRNELTQSHASPQLVAANHILALSSAALQALIQREVEENPAMEMEELPICQQCGRPLQGGFCDGVPLGHCRASVRDQRLTLCFFLHQRRGHW